MFGRKKTAAPVAEEFPVCTGCGKRHAPPKPEQVLEYLKDLALTEAVKVVMGNDPGTFPHLETALTHAAAAARAIETNAQVEAFSAELAGTPTAEEPTR